jgi:hypothetical protein
VGLPVEEMHVSSRSMEMMPQLRKVLCWTEAWSLGEGT